MVIIGVIAMVNLPIAQYPDITPPNISVNSKFTGADAQTVEQSVTSTLETQINGTPGMTHMTSNSTSDGSSAVNISFDLGTNPDVAAMDVQSRVNAATPSLPEQVKRLGVVVRKSSPSFMMVLGFYSPNGTHDANFLGNYLNLNIKDALLRVEGVGDVNVFGNEFSMRIWMKPDRLAAMGMTSNDVIAALQEQNLQIPGGSIGGSPQDDGQPFEYSVLTNSRLKTVEDFEKVIVRATSDGQTVHLKDVAKVELGQFNYGSSSFVKTKSAAFLIIYQAPGANALDTYDGVMAKLDEMKKTFPSDFEYVIPTESVSVVKISIEEVLETFIEALLLVVLVVFLFLQSWRATLIPILAIPVSLIATFIFFIPFGFTINTLTLFGFILAIGIVVDDAIVVVEAVQHKMDHEGLSAKDATAQAMKEITGPVIAIALILAAVFVPVAFIPGIVGKLYQQFAITIAVSVMVSAFIALSLTPALCTLLLKKSETDPAKMNFLDRFFVRFNKWFDRVSNSYTRGVFKWIKKAPYVIILLITITFGMSYLYKIEPTGFIPQEDSGTIYVTYEMKEGTSLGDNVKTMKKIINSIEKIPEIKTIGAIPGFNVISSSTKSNSGTMFVMLKPWDERVGAEHSLQAVMGKVMQATAPIKEARVIPVAPPAIPGLGATAGFTFELKQTNGNASVKELEQVYQKFLGALLQREEIGFAFSFFNTKTPAYQADVDREMAKKLGVSISDVYNTLSGNLGSAYINDINIYGRNFKVVAQADQEYRRDINDLSKIFVRNNTGEMIPLSSLVSYKVVENPANITHYNVNRSIEINGSPKPGYSSGQALKALQEVAAQTLPNGYTYEFSGMSIEEQKSGNTTMYIYMLSIGFVFLLLAALYESWSIPFSVLLAVPIAIFGALFTITMLTFTIFPHLNNNVYCQIGLVTIIGLAAKNAILIVEFAKERVDSGMDIIPATLDAVRLRLRPIIMTSLAFVLGILPMAFASGAGAVSRQSIGWTVFGGMVAASSLAIFVVPVLFVLIGKIAYRNKKIKPKDYTEVDPSLEA